MINNAEQSVIGAYKLVYTGDGTDTDPTTANSFPLGVTSGDINLLAPEWGGAGTETKGYRLEIIIVADQAGNATLEITGAAPGGPEEYICSLACTIGGTVETGTKRWVEAITLTNYHLASLSCVIGDSGNNHPTKFGFDALGYQFIRFYSTSLTNTTEIEVYARIL